MKEKSSHSTKDSYMALAESKVYLATSKKGRESESDGTCHADDCEIHRDHIYVNLTQELEENCCIDNCSCNWKEIDRKFDQNEQKTPK